MRDRPNGDKIQKKVKTETGLYAVAFKESSNGAIVRDVRPSFLATCH